MTDFETFQREYELAAKCYGGHSESKALGVECRRHLMALSKLCTKLRKDILAEQKAKEAERKAKKALATPAQPVQKIPKIKKLRVNSPAETPAASSEGTPVEPVKASE